MKTANEGVLRERIAAESSASTLKAQFASVENAHAAAIDKLTKTAEENAMKLDLTAKALFETKARLQDSVDRYNKVKAENSILEKKIRIIRRGTIECFRREKNSFAPGSHMVDEIEARNIEGHGGDFVLDCMSVLSCDRPVAGQVHWVQEIYGIDPSEGKTYAGNMLEIINAYGTLQLCFYHRYTTEDQSQKIASLVSRARNIQANGLAGKSTTAAIDTRLCQLLDTVKPLVVQVRQKYRDTL